MAAASAPLAAACGQTSGGVIAEAEEAGAFRNLLDGGPSSMVRRLASDEWVDWRSARLSNWIVTLRVARDTVVLLRP